MEITESELTAQYERANSTWPFIHQTELARGLPPMLLFAVGSRETNLTNEVGDFGHGHGVWQGFEGAQAVRDAQHLIYKTLYVEAIKAANRTPADAQAAINADPAERTALTVAVAGEWFIVLRGQVVDAADIAVVHNNIDSKRVWTQ